MDADGNATSTSSPPPDLGVSVGSPWRTPVHDPSSPAFQAAQKACGSVIGKAG